MNVPSNEIENILLFSPSLITRCDFWEISYVIKDISNTPVLTITTGLFNIGDGPFSFVSDNKFTVSDIEIVFGCGLLSFILKDHKRRWLDQDRSHSQELCRVSYGSSDRC